MAFKNIYFCFSLLVSLWFLLLFSHPSGSCINTFLFLQHPLPLLPTHTRTHSFFLLRVFIWTDKSAVALWQDTLGSYLLWEGGMRKIVSEWQKEEGWYVQVQKFTAFMLSLIRWAPVCSPEGHHSSRGQPGGDLPLISTAFETLERATEGLPLWTNTNTFILNVEIHPLTKCHFKTGTISSFLMTSYLHFLVDDPMSHKKIYMDTYIHFVYVFLT